MVPVLTVFFMLLFVLLCILGILANGFIVLMLSREWLRCGRLPPSDMILLGLGASRFCQQCFGLVNSFYYYLHLVEYSSGLGRQVISLHWDFFNSATFWFGTWLSVLFCIKIANFSHPAFLWLKWRLSGLVPWLLLGSVLVSFMITLMFFWRTHTVYEAFLPRNISGNTTFKEWNRKLEIDYFMPLKLANMSIPCSLFLVSILLLISSLRRHTLRMQHNAHSLQDPSTQVHRRALKSLIFFLVLYALSFMSMVIDATVFISPDNTWYWPWQIILYLCMSVHPFILITNNLRFRGKLRKLLLLARGFWVA
ncbi:taste receptor type 2 member 41 [Nannospalax galili]|uniref:Taste receptor type 2 n=1 Tax=Nannospalax galili TaxID=1026970 RepID=A0A0N9NBR0_NANGA|nr:taste receptor type 2 member 41 [Nannospalax galili]ALG93380.1 taste receptor type 2 member 8 [Nannospalax galili]ALG93381.1 taste receptor type 2 member 8 [Nannospalax galili]ALG93382.1 taste receptor type 2 member 8 [Nannospalax galili]ALG93383.1 taste receptor type 2 member 8 [Nannospalax galili]ALG93384.1 taste receptor type 2 member 8 [Nannospalax galili]